MEEIRKIPRPEVTVAQVIVLMLGSKGPMSFQEILNHPSVASLGQGRTSNSFYTALARLKRRKHVVRQGYTYELTSSGQYAALKAHVRKGMTELKMKAASAVGRTESASGETKSAKATSVPRWDGKWRVAFFDMPESKRALRDYLRNTLQKIGFYEFQRSMWIWPYQPPSFLIQLFEDPIFRPHTRLITTYDIDYDSDLRRRFKLIGSAT